MVFLTNSYGTRMSQKP